MGRALSRPVLKREKITEAAINSTPSLPFMEEVTIPPTEEELNTAIDSLTLGKAPGRDGGIQAELLQCMCQVHPPPRFP